MERKITIMVFTLASVLVLAVFSANENAYAGVLPNGENLNNILPTDDLHCYEMDTNPLQQFPIRLVDQFQDRIHEVLEIVEICNPVTKIPQAFPISLPQSQQHWTSYLIDAPQNPQIIATVDIEDQYHPGGFQVDVTDFAEFLMVPASKEHNGIFPNRSDIHFKCYSLVNTTPIIDATALIDQFGFSQYLELLPVEICTPVEKFSESSPGVFDQFEGGDNDIDEHYLCYETSPENTNIVQDQLVFGDQFLQDSATLRFDSVLCTIASKAIIPSPTVGGFNVPIDQSALLLAGVQSISMWMIPVILAGIGIGVFVIKRKK